MDNTYNQYEFENFLTTEFFDGNEKSEVGKLIKTRLITDKEFNTQYTLWLEDSEYESWKDFYKELQDAEDIAWENMRSNDEDED